MHRLFFIFLFCLVLQGISFAQEPGGIKKDTVAVFLKSPGKQGHARDSSLYHQLVSTYGDSILNVLDSLLKDSAFINSLGGIHSLEYAQFVSLFNKDYFPARPLAWVSDFEGVFTSEQAAELDSLIAAFERQTAIEIAVVTVHRSWTSKDRFDSLVMAIHNGWGVGKMESNNGIVIGISAGLRRVRISNGEGIVPLLTDEETKRIIDEMMVPEYKEGNYFEGTKNGLLALMKKTGR
ncbi:MAG: TPM domain-containing protein [Chitinophagaceae bacterium]|nr:TPM domain-containing protein [Chitinophagaceae bacterium]